MSDLAPTKPQQLKAGDHCRVISLGLDIGGISKSQDLICRNNIESIGLNISYGKHIHESNFLGTPSIDSRISDLNDALSSSEVKLILPSLGGMSVAQLLDFIDWTKLGKGRQNFSGFSDYASLLNAIYCKTGLITYYGPFYGTFGMKVGLDYTLEMYKKCLFSSEPFRVNQSNTWSDDAWWTNQDERTYHQNQGPVVINEGEAAGTLLGGHLTSFSTLYGTEYLPDLRDCILMIEENSEITPRTFDRLLQTTIRQPGFDQIRGLLIGRFTRASKMTNEVLLKILMSYPQLFKVPIVSNLSFGHTYPQFTFPIGGTAKIKAKVNEVILEIISH
jgi:muramoyltetrapeptide carboxypeptidase LdcA involved in peptidoglycan recycling